MARTNTGDLATGVGISPSTMSYHLGRLAKLGLVRHEGIDYVLSEPGRVARLLYAYRPPADLIEGFLDLWEDFAL